MDFMHRLCRETKTFYGLELKMLKRANWHELDTEPFVLLRAKEHVAAIKLCEQFDRAIRMFIVEQSMKAVRCWYKAHIIHRGCFIIRVHHNERVRKRLMD